MADGSVEVASREQSSSLHWAGPYGGSSGGGGTVKDSTEPSHAARRTNRSLAFISPLLLKFKRRFFVQSRSMTRQVTRSHQDADEGRKRSLRCQRSMEPESKRIGCLCTRCIRIRTDTVVGTRGPLQGEILTKCAGFETKADPCQKGPACVVLETTATMACC